MFEVYIHWIECALTFSTYWIECPLIFSIYTCKVWNFDITFYKNTISAFSGNGASSEASWAHPSFIIFFFFLCLCFWFISSSISIDIQMKCCRFLAFFHFFFDSSEKKPWNFNQSITQLSYITIYFNYPLIHFTFTSWDLWSSTLC